MFITTVGGGMLASAVVGGLMSGSGGGGSTGGKVEPWSPAQPYILDQLKNNQTLQDFYQQNPINQQQQTAYQNTFNDLNQFRSQTVPGLMDFSNGAMTNNYQRQRGGAPGSYAGYSQPAQQAQPAGLLSTPTAQAQEPVPMQALMQQPMQAPVQPAIQQAGMVSTGQPGPFSVAPPQQLPPAMQPTSSPQSGIYGQIDTAATNPFKNIPAPAAAAPTTTLDELKKMMDEINAQKNYGYAGNAKDGGFA